MPPQTTVPPFLTAASAAGTSPPTGAKIRAASSGSGGASVEIPGPFGAEPAGEILRRAVAWPGERKQPATLVPDHLGDDVGSGAKPVDADQGCVPGHAQGAIADQPGAHQRRRLDIAITGIDQKAIALVGDGQLGIAPIDLVAGKARAVAQVFPAAAAIFAFPAGPAEPGDADPVANRKAVDFAPLLNDGADDLVPQHQRQFGVGQFAVEDMKVGPADGAGLDRDQHLLRPRPRLRQFRGDERLTGFPQQFRTHRFTPVPRGSTFNASLNGAVAMLCVRRVSAILAASSLCMVGGCHLAPTGGMAGRCADLMRQADPGADIDVTNSEAAATSITTIIAHVEGVRSDLPPHGSLPRHLAVECRFHGDILTGFRWTKGPT